VRHQDVAARIDAADGNTLILAVPRSWTEVARIETHDSVMVRTMYASPKPPLTIDQTSAGVGSQLLTDPVGDVPHGWIDILSGGWSTRLAVVMMDLRAVVVPSDGERGRDRRAPAPRQWSNGAWQP
jgi:hypothetical protein